MNRYLLLIAFGSCFLVNIALAQDKSRIVQQRIEFISEQLETEQLDLTNLLEQLNYYFDHPINLNDENLDALEDLGLLTEIQINDLKLHRKQFGKLISIYELQALRYWDLETIEMLRPFIRVDDRLDQLHVSLKEALKFGKTEFYLRYQRTPESRPGYESVADSLKLLDSKYYRGNADRYYSRARFSYRNNLSIGVTAEKDPGEEFFKGSQAKSGFDFYSAHAYYAGGKYLKAVALGDYQVQIGQGLNFWSGYAFGKTADVTNIKKNARALKPYTSVDENRFLRGAAVDLGYKGFELTLFASQKKVDAAIIEDTLLEELEFVSSIDLSGFHRTTSELAKRDALTERIAGLNWRYRKGSFQGGVAGIYQGYNQDYSKSLQPYNQFDFRGKQLFSVSGDYSYVWRNFNFFGELSRVNSSGDIAALQGVIVALDSRATLSLLYRNYGKGYQTFYNNGFAESSVTQNESGFYAGLQTRLNSRWTINTYIDFFSQPWLKYQVNQPAHGNEYLFQLSYKPARGTEIYGRFRQQVKEKNIRGGVDDESITPIEALTQRNYRLNFAHKLTEAVQIKSRIEYVTIDRPSAMSEQGVLFTQDVLIEPKSSPIRLALRYALFDTDSYDTRIYSFENNALYVFSVPAYYYQGSRAYITLRYKFLRRCDLWVRYGTFLYADRQSVGSGKELISGNRKTDITVQFRLKF
ncbi:MAG: hypothetical protein EP338_05155 [Bacteroidetes bacterium]|nr:MAG: hypothetical protein EP338_05155 [Bacteroidota bacterium]